MEKEEFLKKKEETANFLLEYEKFLKSERLIDSIYLQMFGDLMKENMRLSILVDKYHNAIGMKERGDDIEDIKKMMATAFKAADDKYSQLQIKISNEIKNSKNLNRLNVNDLKKIEEYFGDKCMKYHPILEMSISQDMERLWRFFVYFYQNNNYEGLKQIGGELEKLYKEEKSDLYPKYVEFYDNAVTSLKNQMAADMTRYPFAAKEIIEDDMKSANETAKFRQSISDLKEEMHKQEKKYKELYGEIEVF